MTDPVGSVAERLGDLVGAAKVDTNRDRLREVSVDRFKKYQAVHGIYDGPFPCAIVHAESTEDVAAVLAFADAEGLAVVPRTGGTGTEGGLETTVPDTIVLDGSRMDAILDIDETDMQATAQCGVPLRVLEERLREQGLTTGHSPQSQPLAQMGGLVATRSIGQLSTLYGGIEDMVVGLEAVLPDGTVTRVKNVPRRAAGPDIRHVVIGNEGGLCFVTEVTVKVFRAPERQVFHGYLVDDLTAGVAVLREVMVAGYRPSVCRVYSPEDAGQHFATRIDGWSGDKWVLVLVAEGNQRIAEATSAGISDIVGEVLAGRPHEVVEPAVIEAWFADLNWGPDKIAAEQEQMLAEQRLGYTTEISVPWSQVGATYDAVVGRVRSEFARAGDITLLGAHSSHSYQNGTNLYFVYDYRIDCEPREEIEVYHRPLNAIVVEEALAHGGSMVHHHGIGKYRTEWVEQEHGSAYPLLARLKDAFDPRGTMNPGTVWPAADRR